MPSITPNLWFDGQAMEAAELYCSIFPNSKVTDVLHYTEAGPGEPGTVVTVSFELDGQPFVGINGGPAFTFDEAVSFEIRCKDQAEVDHYWDALIAGGGEPSQCGWLKDRYGLSWQVVPDELLELISEDDPERARRATEAMYKMQKLDVAELRAAADAA
jgi:predicted 3-demethylubiquinone-9 3-methyltransferase (glyoxalase superfamily)